MQSCVIVLVLQVRIGVVLKKKTGGCEIRLLYAYMEGGNSVAILSVYGRTSSQ